MSQDAAHQHIPALDGIRGFAILAVIAFHARIVFTNTGEMPRGVFQVVSQGRLGVTLFFVLSGFLITGILLDTRTSPEYFQRFYIRRVLRIFPLYFAYLLLIFTAVRAVWIFAAGTDPWATVGVWWYLGYIQNLPAAHATGHLFLNHLWSLAIEEQFYLAWPALVWLLPRKWLPHVCLALALLALVLRCTLTWDGETVYRFTLCRVDGLALGAFVAIGWRDFRAPLERWAPAVLFAASTVFGAILLVAPLPTWDGPLRTYGESIFVLASASAVFLARSGGGVVQRVCSHPFLRTCGKYSYAMYVLHVAPQWFVEQRLRGMSGPLALGLKYLYFPALVATSLGLAWISWKFLESRFLRLKDAPTWRRQPRLQPVFQPARPAESGPAAEIGCPTTTTAP